MNLSATRLPLRYTISAPFAHNCGARLSGVRITNAYVSSPNQRMPEVSLFVNELSRGVYHRERMVMSFQIADAWMLSEAIEAQIRQ